MLVYQRSSWLPRFNPFQPGSPCSIDFNPPHPSATASYRACILWVRQYFTLWPSMLFGKAVDTCQEIHPVFRGVWLFVGIFVLGGTEASKISPGFFSNKNSPWKNRRFFLRSHVGGWWRDDFPFSIMRWCLAAYESYEIRATKYFELPKPCFLVPFWREVK